ncbi:MAG TPA: hypothetical protein PLP64_02480 [Pseudothermotoga sp.]|nr:hypothetical protein [Pseudothermotoga sp.]HOK83074.1 hypothetical protein [Pseudothermotoga sp.]HPP69755.1 hypothetical protein [Pseudothermotoga sp.]
MPRKFAILLAVLIFVGLAAYFDVYDYLRFNTLVKKIDSELIRLLEYDKNVTAKREYVDLLEKTIEPKIKLSQIKELAQELNVSFSVEKDGTYVLSGEVASDDFSQILTRILNSANVNVKSMSATNTLKVPIDVPGVTNEGSVNFKMVLTGVMVE